MATREPQHDSEMEEDEDEQTPGPSTMPQGPPIAQGEKRTIMVDPTTGEELPDPKRSKIELDEETKGNCIILLARAYIAISSLANVKDLMDCYYNVTLSHQITSIIFTIHNYYRQELTKADSNLRKKTVTSDFKITHLGVDYTIKREKAMNAWMTEVLRLGLEYKKFDKDEKKNWIGTIGPYLNFSSAFGLRINELRIGHQKMPVGKDSDGNIKCCYMSRYGLVGAHQILLEGNTYPPERRASMAQSIGPMTAFLSMIRSEGIYRTKWENAVKKMMSHIGPIDDVIAATRNVKDPQTLSPLIATLADILLITTSRQSNRIAFPLCFYPAYFLTHKGEPILARIKSFNCSGVGAYRLYKFISKQILGIEGDYTPEQAAEVSFHGMFGTYKEDLSLLAAITTRGTWSTREELGVCFKKSSKRLIKFEPIGLKYYSKMASANQTGLLSGVYTQVIATPCFSGYTRRGLTDDFFTHLQRRTAAVSGGKTIPQLVNSLSTILESLQEELRSKDNTLTMGTKAWKSMDELRDDGEGEDLELVIPLSNRFFMGKT